jgi:hypothetical protein
MAVPVWYFAMHFLQSFVELVVWLSPAGAGERVIPRLPLYLVPCTLLYGTYSTEIR